MADVFDIFGGEFIPPAKPVERSPQEQLSAAIAETMQPPLEIHLDGKLHRFHSSDRKGDKTGWYIAYGDGVPAGSFGCWRQNITENWRADIGRELTMIESLAYKTRMLELRETREREQQKKHAVAATTVESIWDNAIPADSSHPYLKRKLIQPHHARVTGDGRLILPIFIKNVLSSLQYIDGNGVKAFQTGGAIKEGYTIIGKKDKPLYLAEGFATAATIHEATGHPVAVAYSAQNMINVARALSPSIIFGDNDESGVGQACATEAAKAVGARCIIPPVLGDANDYAVNGGDIMALVGSPSPSWLVSADDFCRKPAPITWLIKGWLQGHALMMVHGPSGSGKTFITLDMLLSIASKKETWFGHRVNPGPVVVLAGEGHHGLAGRISAWKQYNEVEAVPDMWVSRAGCDLNTPTGLATAVNAIDALPVNPSIICVDTLHRFMAGDENSAQDAKTMLDACASLMMRYNCSVLLVHHTGVSEEAQHRARGSSAWRGALDIEVSVLPGKIGEPIQIIQRKSKDAELAKNVNVELQKVEINGWIDEDGDQVGSAVVVKADFTKTAEVDKTLSKFRKMFESAWWASGATLKNDLPYLCRDDLKSKLAADGLNARTITNYMNKSYPKNIIGYLSENSIIVEEGDGWVVIDDMMMTCMLLAKGEI